MYIFGHSANPGEETGTTEDLKLFANYLGQVLQFAEKEFKRGVRKEEFIKNTSIPGNTLWSGQGIERPLTARFMRALNSWVSRKIVTASATQNVENEPVGALNRFYGNVYHPIAAKVNAAARTLKQRNRPLYRVLQYGLVLGVLYLIFV